ncbi:MAG: hypothetical protein IJV62_05410, partial [Eggerthellaceae bacterium]|nr:hypothetical protein [Eggerthellaceae bacterium]
DFLAQEADTPTKKVPEKSSAEKVTKAEKNTAVKKAAAKKQPATLKKSLEEKKQSVKPAPQKDIQASEVHEAARKEPATQPTPSKMPKAAIPSSDAAAKKPAPKQAGKTHVQAEEKQAGKAQVSSASAQKKMDTTPLAGKEKPQQKKAAKAAIDVQGVVEDVPVYQATTSEDPLHAAQEKVAAQLRAVSNEEHTKEKKTAKKVDTLTQKAEKDAAIKEQMQGKKDAKAASAVTDKKDEPAKSKEDTPKKEQSKKKQDKAKVQDEPVETFLKDDGTFHSPRALKIPNDSERPTLLNKIRRAKKEGDAKRKKSK